MRKTLLHVLCRVGVGAVAFMLVVFILLPFGWMISTSLKNVTEVQTIDVHWIPKQIAWSNYEEIWSVIPFVKYIRNTLIVSAVTVTMSLCLSSLAAYALSKMQFAGKELFSIGILATQLMPGILFLLPIFIMFINFQQWTGIHLLPSLHGLVLAYSTFSLPFAIWMLKGYFETIPIELEEAARIDGCSRFGSFRRIIVPLAKPGLSATAIFVFLLVWNELMFAVIMTNQASRTFAPGLREFEMTQGVVHWHLLAAAATTVTLPTIAIFFLAQRYIVSGLTRGAVKG
jgi:multiple sugar transport system permease protein